MRLNNLKVSYKFKLILLYTAEYVLAVLHMIYIYYRFNGIFISYLYFSLVHNACVLHCFIVHIFRVLCRHTILIPQSDERH